MATSRLVKMPNNKKQFTIGAIMVLTALVAALIRWKHLLVTIAIIELIVVYVCVEVLVTQLPRTISKSIERNCRRSDGSRSARRARAEQRAVSQLRSELVLAFAIVVLPTNALLWLLNSEVIPISVGVSAISSFRFSEATWKEELSTEERELEEWGRRKQISPSSIESRKRTLWRYWPLLVIAGFTWCAVAAAIIKSAYFHALKDLAASIEYRRQQNKLVDLSRTEETSA